MCLKLPVWQRWMEKKAPKSVCLSDPPPPSGQCVGACANHLCWIRQRQRQQIRLNAQLLNRSECSLSSSYGLTHWPAGDALGDAKDSPLLIQTNKSSFNITAHSQVTVDVNIHTYIRNTSPGLCNYCRFLTSWACLICCFGRSQLFCFAALQQPLKHPPTATECFHAQLHKKTADWLEKGCSRLGRRRLMCTNWPDTTTVFASFLLSSVGDACARASLPQAVNWFCLFFHLHFLHFFYWSFDPSAHSWTEVNLHLADLTVVMCLLSSGQVWEEWSCRAAKDTVQNQND